MPDSLRLPQDLRRIAFAAGARETLDAAIIPQERRADVLGPLEIAGKYASTVANVGFHLKQVIGVAIKHASMKLHHLHQANRTTRTDGSWLELGILGQQYARQKTGRQLQLAGLLDNRSR